MHLRHQRSTRQSRSMRQDSSRSDRPGALESLPVVFAGSAATDGRYIRCRRITASARESIRLRATTTSSPKGWRGAATRDPIGVTISRIVSFVRHAPENPVPCALSKPLQPIDSATSSCRYSFRCGPRWVGLIPTRSADRYGVGISSGWRSSSWNTGSSWVLGFRGGPPEAIQVPEHFRLSFRNKDRRLELGADALVREA